MNSVILMGRVTKDAQFMGTAGKVASTNLAVDRFFNGEKSTIFVPIKFLGESLAVRVEKYLKKGIKICIQGELNIGEYTNKDGNKTPYSEVLVRAWEFCESKGTGDASASASAKPSSGMPDFMSVGTGDSELPFS